MAKVKVWKRSDGGVSVTHFDFNKKPSGMTDEEYIERDAVRLRLRPELQGAQEFVMDSADIPTGKDEREFWDIEGGRVRVSAFKKAAKQSKRQDKRNKRNAVLAKLGITAAEFQELIEGVR